MKVTLYVAVPHLGDQFPASVGDLKANGYRYIPERKCWVGEEPDVEAQIIGDFEWNPTWHPDQLMKEIDRSADFKAGREG